MIEHHSEIHEMDGAHLYYSFLAGSRKILQHQEEINKINVFPVPDGDTGTNLASTIRTIMDNTTLHDEFHITANSIAESALDGARGNSGVIFAQFLYGISQEVGEMIRVNLKKYADIMKRSVKYVYEAIGNPREGTMISVIRDWAEHLFSNKDKNTDFTEAIHNSYKIAQVSLEKTTEQLDILKKANVVDAGAKGFVLFLEGMLEFLKNEISRQELKEHINDIPVLELEEAEVSDADLTFKYCTEALIEGKHLNKLGIRKVAEAAGDSLVLAGSDHKLRLHVHTDDPAGLFHHLRKYGDLVFQKADDMHKQYEIAHERKWNIGLMTDSAHDLPEDIMHKYQIQMCPINLYFGKNHYLDKLTITPDYFYEMLQTTKVHPTTAQPNVKSFANILSHMASHYDSIISINMGSKLSGTFNSAQQAAEKVTKEMKKKISVIDSRNVSAGLGLQLLRAAQAIESGMQHDELVKKLEEWKDKIKVLVAPATMKYFIKGGRVSKMKGLIANLFHILPIISVTKEGKAETFDKGFSHKAVMNKIMGYVQDFKNSNEIWEYAIVHAHSEENAETMRSLAVPVLGKEPVYIQNLSPVIGAHAGPGTVAIILMAK